MKWKDSEVSKTTYPHALPQDVDNVRLDPTGKPIQPLSEEFADLFVALDRLLSIGSYYTPEHARYQEVAAEAHSAIRKNLMGERPLVIECTLEGFWVHEIFVENDLRETRRVFELMSGLNIALLEISPAVATSDLHEAVAILKRHQVQNAGKKNYEEIEIEGLPDTITTTSQSLHVKTQDRTSGPGGTRPRTASADHYVIPDANLVPTPDGQKLERQFLSIISGIMSNGDPTQLEDLAGDAQRDEVVSDWVPDSAVQSIKEIMIAMKQTNSDPMIMEHLIGHAQAALELTADPMLVELIFERLRKETGVKSEKSKSLLENRPKPKNTKKSPIKYTMTPDQMNEIIDELTGIANSPEDLLAPSSADCLGICAQILYSAPTEHMILGIGTSISRILSAESLTTAAAMAAIIQTGSRETIDGSLPLFLGPLRGFHSSLLGPVWLNVWKALEETGHKKLAWPHLVNDLLLGIEWNNPGEKLALYETLSRINVGDGEEMLSRLEELQALKRKKLSPEIFHAPAPLLYPVHLVLLGSTMAQHHGPKLFERLFHQRAQQLSNLLITIMGEYRQANKLIYQAILDQGVTGKIQPKLQDMGSRLLAATIRNLKPVNREDLWVTEAISWLGQLDPKRAKPILKRILGEKKLFLFPVWPAECRQAAKKALADLREPPREMAPKDEDTTGAEPDPSENDEE